MPSSVSNIGWNSGTWGRNGWGSPQILISVDGVGGTGAVGTTTTATGKFINVSGVTTTGNVGSVTLQTSFSQSVTGVGANGEIGSVDVPLIASGVSASMQVGTVLIWGQVQTAQTPNWKEIKEAA